MPGKAANVDRDRISSHRRLMGDYFNENATYDCHTFRRRFRMRRSLFLRIVDAVASHDPYFTQRRDALGMPGLSSIQKVTAAVRQMAYGTSADQVDEYVRIAESTAMECLKKFCHAVCQVFQETYLRSPNQQDVQRLLEMHERRGWPGMLGSLDCMHWGWKNCPRAWSGQYEGK